MCTVLHVTPPLLMPWLSDDEVDRSLVLLNLEPDVLDGEILKLNLVIGFNAVAVYRESHLEEADYFLGCKSAEVIVRTISGEVKNWSPGATLNVEYRGTETKTRTSSLTLQPTVKHKSTKTDTDASLGSINFSAGSERNYEYSFSSEERFLAPLCAGKSIRWRLDSPHGTSAVRDFVYGNLYLFADCYWPDGQRKGELAIRTHEVRLFGPDRKELSSAKSLLMRFKLRNHTHRIQGKAGFVVTFAESRS